MRWFPFSFGDAAWVLVTHRKRWYDRTSNSGTPFLLIVSVRSLVSAFNLPVAPRKSLPLTSLRTARMHGSILELKDPHTSRAGSVVSKTLGARLAKNFSSSSYAWYGP
jgi:hypothetical protein